MKIILTALLIAVSFTCFSQQPYWQQDLNYTIDVTLNDQEKSLTGFETIIYKNNSPQALDFIWFHIWPNAYKNEETALFQQLLNDPARKKKMNKYSAGFIDGLSFKVNNNNIVTVAHPQYIDIIKLILPSSLKPGDSITITTPFKVMLPSYFSRSGFSDGEFMACQWYPKPAVYDKDGWHEFPYLDMGEFYSEYGFYKVNISVPAEYVIGATGVLQTADELALYKTAGAKNVADRSGKRTLYKPADAKTIKTLTYIAEHVPDFGWFADKEFAIQYDTVQLSTGKVVDVFSYYHNNKKTLWNNSIDYIKDAVKHYTDWIGEYSYPVVQAVEGPKNNSSGGMEYPMITLITSPDSKEETLDAVITHEVGHNWFMSMLGSNERKHTWMDEGLNTYFQFRYEAEKYRANSVLGTIPEAIQKMPADMFEKTIYNVIAQIPMQPQIELSAEKFASSDDYGLIEYVKTALWVHLLEISVGREKLDSAFKNYFNEWEGKHPQPEDMKASFEESMQVKLDDFYKLLNKEGAIAR